METHRLATGLLQSLLQHGSCVRELIACSGLVRPLRCNGNESLLQRRPKAHGSLPIKSARAEFGIGGRHRRIQLCRHCCGPSTHRVVSAG